MRKLYIAVTIFFVNVFASAQQQLENASFENWEGSGASLEPFDWSSLKTSDNTFLAQSAPVVLFQDAGRDGGFSVKVENKSALGIVANGILTNGRVHSDLNPANGYVFTDASDVKWNSPFTSRPDSIVGWFKYQPASAAGNFDKGKVDVLLHKTVNGQNPVGNTAANMIGKARYNLTETTLNWTRFSAPFDYSSTNSPDYILVVLTSGDSTSAITGSIAWFDDLELIYNPVSLNSNASNNLLIAQFGSYITIKNIPEGAHFSLVNALGQTLAEGCAKPHETKIALSDTGVYFVRIASNKGVFTRKVAFVKD